MNKEKLKVAVIGVGSLGQHHARIYSEFEDVELVAVVDADFVRAKEIATQFNCQAYADLDPIFDKIDAASVVVPTVMHHQVARSLLGRGIHVLLEKPMTKTIEEADDLVDLAGQSELLLQIGHIEQFNAGVKMLKKHLRHPRFIECHRVGPFVARGTDVHVILDLMIHDIDIILSLVPSELVEIRAAGTSVLTPQIDIANIRLAFEDGCVANVTASRVSQEKLRKIRIFQPDAYFSLDYTDQEMKVYRRQMKDDGTPYITTEKIATEKEEPLKAELASFIQSIKEEGVPKVTGEDGRRALDIALQVVDLIKNAEHPSA